MKLYKTTYLIPLLLIITALLSPTLSQDAKTSLHDVIRMARQKSFEAFKAKNLFLGKAIDFESYKYSLHPKLNWSVTPSDYSRSIQEQWNSGSERYQPYNIQSITSKSNIIFNQPIGFTGGTLSLNSYLYRYSTYQDESQNSTSYITYPLRLTYTQDFFKLNTYKWRKKTAPLEFQAAKKQYLKDVENVSAKAVEMFFSLLIAEMNFKIALLNKNNADTLYIFGQKKLGIGAITRDNYLKLNLKKINAGITLESSIREKQQAQLALNDFLELPQETVINCQVPDKIKAFEISPQEAIAKATENNPDLINLQKELIQAEKTLKQSKTSRLSASFSATVGLNQNQETFVESYNNLKDQQSVYFTLSIPILDWGDRNRDIAHARLQRELVEENTRNHKNAIELEVINIVNDFNIKRKQLIAAAQADSIAQLTYTAVQQQFMLGKASVLDVNSAYNELQYAKNSYLGSLKSYWQQLYIIRKLCLYDFETETDLNANFDQLLETTF